MKRVLLIDQSEPLVDAWKEAFRGIDIVEAAVADYFAEPADAMVSPANSFGIMDGGLDLAIRDELGTDVERRVQKAIEDKHHGELPIGAAEIVPTDDARWPWLVCAPTMRVPEDISGTVHAYWAFRAILLAVRQHSTPIGSLLCSGLGTGVGRMPPRRCAAQMRKAWQQIAGEPHHPSFGVIHTGHQAMKRTE